MLARACVRACVRACMCICVIVLFIMQFNRLPSCHGADVAFARSSDLAAILFLGRAAHGHAAAPQRGRTANGLAVIPVPALVCPHQFAILS